ncbi:hypothetical protein [Candidatus Palauibacter sp.]|uniref:hypothetical protein n=1 Tax=Candidatus Palauibacter sp. TaxID=3101350 RepID=UPI003B028469
MAEFAADWNGEVFILLRDHPRIFAVEAVRFRFAAVAEHDCAQGGEGVVSTVTELREFLRTDAEDAGGDAVNDQQRAGIQRLRCVGRPSTFVLTTRCEPVPRWAWTAKRNGGRGAICRGCGMGPV